jgi:cysteine desulfurase
VLTAMGYGPQEAMGALRLTLGRENTEVDVDFVVAKLPEIVARLRTGS